MKNEPTANLTTRKLEKDFSPSSEKEKKIAVCPSWKKEKRERGGGLFVLYGKHRGEDFPWEKQTERGGRRIDALAELYL